MLYKAWNLSLSGDMPCLHASGALCTNDSLWNKIIKEKTRLISSIPHHTKCERMVISETLSPSGTKIRI